MCIWISVPREPLNFQFVPHISARVKQNYIFLMPKHRVMKGCTGSEFKYLHVLNLEVRYYVENTMEVLLLIMTMIVIITIKINNNRARFPTCFTLVSCLAYSSALKKKATRSSEISDDFQQTTRRYIPEDRTLHNYRCENL
jgi:hypothetical protein